VTAKNGLVIAIAISALYVAALAYPVHRHVVGVFSDFYVRFAPDADRIAAGEFPRNTYNPPGYPALLVLARPLAPDHFTTGKWMSLVAGGLTGVLAFLLFRRLFGVRTGVLAVPIVLSSAAFATYAITAMTDVPFVCLSALAMLAITSESPHRLRWIALSGVLCGAVYLMRYNALFLLVPGLAAAVWGPGDWPSRVRRGALFLASVLLTISPWLWASYVHWGAPFYSTNYEDVARAFGIARPGGFRSLSDVVLHDPARFAWGYATNLGPILYRSLGAGLALLPVGPLAVVGIGLALARHRRKPVLLVLLAALSFLLLMTLTHWEKRYFFFLLVCYSGFSALAIVEIAAWVEQRFGAPRAARLAMALLMLWILAPSAVTVSRAAAKTLSRQPVELLPAARAVALDAAPQATVMSVRAQMAYLSGRAWRPLPGADSIDDLKVKIQDQPPGYIAYDRWARKYLPQLKALADPAAARPPWLVPVYSHPSITVYRVELPRPVGQTKDARSGVTDGSR
jgi:Dolichyl-phosphate-mannose-protein mannosyltransferase